MNGDGQIDCADVDSLVAAVTRGSNDRYYDLTGDGLVNIADLDEWRVQGGAANLPSGNPYLIGDANLDGVVDGQDFIAWNIHKFTNEASWCHGDFAANGVIDGQDFIQWNNHKFMSSDSVTAVPEPTMGIWWLVLGAVATGRRRSPTCRSSQKVLARAPEPAAAPAVPLVKPLR